MALLPLLLLLLYLLDWILINKLFGMLSLSEDKIKSAAEEEQGAQEEEMP